MAKTFYTTAVTLLMVAAFSVPALALKKNRKLSPKITVSAKKLVHLTTKSHRVSVRKVRPLMLASLKEAHVRHTPADPTSGGMNQPFEQQKGHLVWPVDSKNITMHFGLQTYIPGVRIDNLGINIAIDKDSTVRAVYDGVVVDVMDIGDGKAVIISHGKYFTIYSDLSKTTFTRGQQVTAGDPLGQVGSNGQLEFRIYDPHDVWMNPEKWLMRAGPAKGK